MFPRMPLVIILGATGSGKTKLSLEIAKKFGGQVVGADSMQVYKGLDIITAKATLEEQSQAPHHLIDILEPHETFSVLEYRNRALNVINNLLEQKKIPIVVGGTNYYIESLLWRILVDNETDDNFSKEPILPHNDYLLTNDELHQRLKLLDPVMAKRLHPNNRRKILRALEVLYQKGKKLSDIINEQKSGAGGNTYGGGLRYPDSLVLWLQCEKDILDKRLNERVDTMIKDGLLVELLNFHKLYNKERHGNSENPDYTKGIFQSIGFKEFHPYLLLSENDRNSEVGRQKLSEGLEQLKMVTRRYAKKQKRWITNRFLARNDREVPPIYGLDTSDVSKWTENVTEVAEQIIQSYLSSSDCPIEPLPKQDTLSNSNNEETSYSCEVCNRLFVGNFQWQLHLKSKKHKVMCSRNK